VITRNTALGILYSVLSTQHGSLNTQHLPLSSRLTTLNSLLSPLATLLLTRCSHRAVVLRAIESDVQALHEVLPVELRRSRSFLRSFLLEAVARNPEVYRVVVVAGAYRGCCSQLVEERDFVIQAVATNGLVLRYASLAFRNDMEIVMLAAKSDRRALRFASVSVATDVSLKFVEHLAPLLADAVVPKTTGGAMRWVLYIHSYGRSQ
jgi:hypothetical protein